MKNLPHFLKLDKKLNLIGIILISFMLFIPLIFIQSKGDIGGYTISEQEIWSSTVGGEVLPLYYTDNIFYVNNRVWVIGWNFTDKTIHLFESDNGFDWNTVSSNLISGINSSWTGFGYCVDVAKNENSSIGYAIQKTPGKQIFFRIFNLNADGTITFTIPEESFNLGNNTASAQAWIFLTESNGEYYVMAYTYYSTTKTYLEIWKRNLIGVWSQIKQYTLSNSSIYPSGICTIQGESGSVWYIYRDLSSSTYKIGIYDGSFRDGLTPPYDLSTYPANHIYIHNGIAYFYGTFLSYPTYYGRIFTVTQSGTVSNYAGTEASGSILNLSATFLGNDLIVLDTKFSSPAVLYLFVFYNGDLTLKQTGYQVLSGIGGISFTCRTTDKILCLGYLNTIGKSSLLFYQIGNIESAGVGTYTNQFYIGSPSLVNITSFQLNNASTYIYPYLSPLTYPITCINISTYVDHINTTTSSGFTSVIIKLGLYVCDSSGLVSVSNPLRLKSWIQFTCQNQTANYTRSYNPAYAIPINRYYAIVLGSSYSGVYIKDGYNAPTMYRVTSVLPTIIQSYSVQANKLALWGIMQYPTMTGYTTVTTTVTTTHTITPTNTATYIPTLLIAIPFILLPALMIGAYTKSGWGMILGMSLGICVATICGLLPFYVLIVMAIIVVGLLVMGGRGSGGNG